MSYELIPEVEMNAQNRDDHWHIELLGEDRTVEVESLRLGGRLIWNEGESPADGRLSQRGTEVDCAYSECIRLEDVALAVTDDAVVVLNSTELIRESSWIEA